MRWRWPIGARRPGSGGGGGEARLGLGECGLEQETRLVGAGAYGGARLGGNVLETTE